MEKKISEEKKKEIIKDIESKNKVPEKIAMAEERLDEKEQLKTEKKKEKKISEIKKSLRGKIVQFRRGRHTIHERHFLLDVGAANRKEAEKFVGKNVEWKSPAGKIIKGKISSAHGNKGIVRAIFEKGLPGQALTTQAEIK